MNYAVNVDHNGMERISPEVIVKSFKEALFMQCNG